MCDLGRRMFLIAIPGTAVLGAFMYGKGTGICPRRGEAYGVATRSRHARPLG